MTSRNAWRMWAGAAWVGVGGLGAAGCLMGQMTGEHPVVTVTRSTRGFEATIDKETMRVTVCGDAVIHVVTRPDGRVVTHPQPWLLPEAESCKGAKFEFAQDAKGASVLTAKVKVSINAANGSLRFMTVDGKALLEETGSVPRTYRAETLNGEQTYEVEERFRPDATEALYGLGQHQSGMFNYRGSVVELAQNNTDIAIPFLTSSKGYGVMWNTAAFSYVDNRFPLELNFEALAGPGIDYFFVYGPEMDAVIHGYRNLTGHAPMLPRWAYGFIESKDRYKSLDEIKAVAARYRAEHIPVDALVQDWYWWKTEGDPEFNANYGDVATVEKDLKVLHDEHIHTMISTWGLLDDRSETYRQMDAGKLLLGNAEVYDPSIAAARDLFWSRLPGKLFAQGWDSFWLDSAEPESSFPRSGDAVLRDRTMAMGNGAEYTNVFPLLHNEGIQGNWRKATSEKRVFLLTRSAFLGQQRVGGTVWSGDIYSSWWALERQVRAGLNYAISGMPYWTTDIGGYHPVGGDGQSLTPEYQELYLRWFEFGTFCPVFRTHGHRPNNEIWSYPAVEAPLIAYDKLRYRLMPYVYAMGHAVASEDATIQRPLVMDFRADPATWNIGDEFMFGPALLVNPVTEAHATTRRVYLPKGAEWYDFWTGAKQAGGRFVEAAAPVERIPLYVRAGAMLPMGPEEEWTGEHPDGPVELRVYAGADGRFTLYADEGDNYNYEQGRFTTIPLRWSEADGTVTIGARTGEFAGMAREMTFHVVLVGAGHGVGGAVESKADKTVEYRGAEMKVKLR